MLTGVTPDYTDSSDGVGDTFDASIYALSYFETVEGMLVTIPNMVVADGFVSTSGGRPFLQAYSLDSANPDQINSRGGYTVAGDPPVGPPDTATPGDDTNHGGRHLHDGDVNPDIIELDFTDFATPPPAGLLTGASMGDQLGDVTGIIDFDFTDRKLFVTSMEPGGFVDGSVTQETTVFGDDSRSLTVAAFNVENLDPGDGAARFTAIANAIANNLNAPDIISIEEMQDNNGADQRRHHRRLHDLADAGQRAEPRHRGPLSVGRSGARQRHRGRRAGRQYPRRLSLQHRPGAARRSRRQRDHRRTPHVHRPDRRWCSRRG